MTGSSHGSARLGKFPDRALNREHFSVNPAVGVGDVGVFPRRRAGLAVSRTLFVSGKSDVGVDDARFINFAVRLQVCDGPGLASPPVRCRGGVVDTPVGSRGAGWAR